MLFTLLPAGALTAQAQQRTSTNAPPEVYGPWNASISASGGGLEFSLPDDDTLLKPEAPWTLLAWVNPTDGASATELVAGMGAPDEEYPRYLALAPGKGRAVSGPGKHAGRRGGHRAGDVAPGGGDL